MKKLSLSLGLCLVALFGSVGRGFASDLPPCPASGYFENCFGTLTLSNGDKYVGEYKQNKRNGKGTYTFPDGEKYTGEWRNGKPHGYGSYTFSDASYYAGNWLEGLKNGQGVYTSPDGSKYVGAWKDHKPNGQGIYTYPNGNEYVGDWRESKKHGNGTLTFVNGNKYVGEFSHDTRSGLGVYHSTDGWTFVGNHLENKRVAGAYLNVTNSQAAYISSNDNHTDRYTRTGEQFSSLRKVFNALPNEQRKKIQDILKKEGLYRISIDGIWGIHTFAAVAEFAILHLDTVDFNRMKIATNTIFEILNLSSD